MGCYDTIFTLHPEPDPQNREVYSEGKQMIQVNLKSHKKRDIRQVESSAKRCCHMDL